MNFTLTKQAAKVAHINLREEMHGEEPILGVDIKITFDSPNDFLSYLSPTLKWSLYDKQTKQGELIEDKGHLPILRYSQLGEMRWDGEMSKCALTIHGAKKSEDLQVEGDAHKLKLDCRDGGTVGVTFTFKSTPTAQQSGALVGMLGKEYKVSLAKLDAE